MIGKGIIKRNFSQCAPYYDRYATIQDLCAQTLIAQINSDGLANILEVGCGTGNYTKLLKEKFPQAKIKALDISWEMIEVAKAKIEHNCVEFIVADGETIYFTEHFDLISSNATLQWFTDIEGALFRYRDLLNKNGQILLSLFGPNTLCELNASLRKLLGKAQVISSFYFIEEAKLAKILQRTFRKVKLKEKIFQEEYHSLSQLLRKIKYTGVRGGGIEARRFWTAKMIDNLEKIYKEKFKQIIASYQVFFCQGLK